MLVAFLRNYVIKYIIKELNTIGQYVSLVVREEEVISVNATKISVNRYFALFSYAKL